MSDLQEIRTSVCILTAAAQSGRCTMRVGIRDTTTRAKFMFPASALYKGYVRTVTVTISLSVIKLTTINASGIVEKITVPRTDDDIMKIWTTHSQIIEADARINRTSDTKPARTIPFI